MNKSVSFGDNTENHPAVVQKKLRKGQVCLCSIFLICNLLMAGTGIYEFHCDTLPKEETCVYPHYDLDHDPPEENECAIYTQCVFEKNETNYNLVEDTVMFLPQDYRVKDQMGKCPFHWELPGYKTRYYGQRMGCDDEDFGCCEVPLDIACAGIIHTHEDDLSYAGYLYDRMDHNEKHYMDIPKEDIEGSNCPTAPELLCETYHSDMYYALPHIFLICLISLIALTLTNVSSKKPCDIYEEQSYTGVSEIASV